LSSDELSSALFNKMPNKWLAHIKKTMKQMKAKGSYIAGKGLKQVIMAAKKTWHKAKRGGGECGMSGGGDDELEDVPLDEPTAPATTGTEVNKTVSGDVAGGRRRKTRRRRHSRRR
jgi:hypothetical protein